MSAFHANVRRLIRENPVFRRVLATSDHCQLAVLSLEPHEDIGEEIHTADQIFLFLAGHGEIVLDGRRTHVLTDDIVVVPGGVRHNVVNLGGELLRLLAIAAPPSHEAGTLHRTKAEARHAGTRGGACRAFTAREVR
jgi:mannose-6-phosphate isomerase-like protein (cupin superfamily)